MSFKAPATAVTMVLTEASLVVFVSECCKSDTYSLNTSSEMHGKGFWAPGATYRAVKQAVYFM